MEIFISLTGNQKTLMLFFKVLGDFQFIIKVFSTHFSNHCPKFIYHMNNHKDPDGWVISVEIISRWTEPQGNIYKKAPNFFSIPKQRFSYFRQLLSNPGLKLMCGFSSNPIYSLKSISSTALSGVSNFYLASKLH